MTGRLRAESYRVRAVELRAIAEGLGEDTKAKLLKIADEYDHMAEQIDRLGLFGEQGSGKT